MNTKNLKAYAPKARRQFIEAVTKRAAHYGIYADRIADVQFEGSAAIIEGRAFSKVDGEKRQLLVKRVEEKGFGLFVRGLAYTWFNRLAAIRYMELHDYLEHGLRVLSRPDQPTGFEVLDHAADVCETLGLNKNKIIDLKLAGNKEEELYREILLGQCHYLHKIMPFLFEAIDDATELLLPDNLTKTDSILHDLVTDVPEEDWQDIEVIGWLYQFYISEYKDAVIGKVVKSEDIPAATQLFTPNWIVKYLVQNSVGHQWLATYPDSELKGKMEYYIEPAEQTAEVLEQLKSITPESLDPESIKVLDPACGSGHILIEVYEVLREIYLERGYRLREIPELILTKNIFGLDIDDRAAQLAGFALLMKAREDDRRIFTRVQDDHLSLNVLSLQETSHLDFATLWRDLEIEDEEAHQSLKAVWLDFKSAKTFGSLVEVSNIHEAPINRLLEQLYELERVGSLFQKSAVELLKPIVQQSLTLSQRYDSLIANPPYMGSKGMNSQLKEFAKKNYPNSKSDLFAIFMERAFRLLTDTGHNAQINMQSWMFLSSYERLREWLLESKTFITMAHLGARAFSQISGEVVQTTAWVLSKALMPSYQPVFFRLIKGSENDKSLNLLDRNYKFSETKQCDFKKVPGNPIAYWISNTTRDVFTHGKSVGSIADTAVGLFTCDNERFLRNWFEVPLDNIDFQCRSREGTSGGKKYYPYNKGGGYRRWYGLNYLIVEYANDGQDIRDYRKESGQSWSLPGEKFYFREGITWSGLTSGLNSFRWTPSGFVFESNKGQMLFSSENDYLIGFLNSYACQEMIRLINPTLSLQSNEVKKLSVVDVEDKKRVSDNSKELIQISKMDWDNSEISWSFVSHPLISVDKDTSRIEETFTSYMEESKRVANRFVSLELESNEIICDAYNLPCPGRDYFERNISLNSSIFYKYGVLDEGLGLEKRLKSDIFCELISYSVGCMMGRYSLDRYGLIYAHSSNQGFKEIANDGIYTSFPADDDGVIPLTDQEWFEDDATIRIREFVKVVWGTETLTENLAFVAESLCLSAIKPKKSESSLDTIRRYLSTQFYKEHLKTYKKRPIYWLFSSGKEKAFECLVYLHRYNEGTLSRMRTQYVTPLMGKFDSYHGQLTTQKADASPSQQRNIEKELKTLEKKQAELRAFDENLKYFADKRISIDLDDGVKVNYGKFGNLLAEVKAITGKK